METPLRKVRLLPSRDADITVVFLAASSFVKRRTHRVASLVASTALCLSLGSVLTAGTASAQTATCANEGQATINSARSYTPDCGTGFRIRADTRLLEWNRLSGGHPFQSASIRSVIRFERNNGSGVDARNTRVACTDSYGGSDSDGENKATSTTVTYNTPGVPPGGQITVTCRHSATYNGVNYSTSTTTTHFAPSR